MIREWKAGLMSAFLGLALASALVGCEASPLAPGSVERAERVDDRVEKFEQAHAEEERRRAMADDDDGEPILR